MALIRDRKPRSVSDLAAWTGRAQPNISRTLAKLEAAGMVEMTDGGNRRKVPLVTVRKITIEMTPTTSGTACKSPDGWRGAGRTEEWFVPGRMASPSHPGWCSPVPQAERRSPARLACSAIAASERSWSRAARTEAIACGRGNRFNLLRGMPNRHAPNSTI